MTKRAAWILVLLVALLAISASVAIAAGLNRPTQAAAAPKQELAVDGTFNMSTLAGSSGGNYAKLKVKSERHTHCHLEDDAPAY